MMVQHLQVAIGLILHQGKILVAWRDAHLAQGNCYEFPGGKLESAESPEQAVIREVMEETGLKVAVSGLFNQIEFSYPERKLSLYFYRCRLLDATDLKPAWHWVALAALPDLSFPAANQPIVARLDWPTSIAMTAVEARRLAKTTGLCVSGSITALQKRLQQADPSSKIMVELEDFIQLPQPLQQRVFAIHLRQPQHWAIEQIQALGSYNLIASCRSEADIAHAQRLHCDAMLLQDQQLSKPYLAAECAVLQDIVLYQPAGSTAEPAAHAYQLAWA